MKTRFDHVIAVALARMWRLHQAPLSTGSPARGRLERSECHDLWLSQGRLECRRTPGGQGAVAGNVSVLVLQTHQRRTPCRLRGPLQEQLRRRSRAEVLRRDVLPAGIRSEDDEDVDHADEQSARRREDARRRVRRPCASASEPSIEEIDQGPRLKRYADLECRRVAARRAARRRDELGGQAVGEDAVGLVAHRVRAPRGVDAAWRGPRCSRIRETRSASP